MATTTTGKMAQTAKVSLRHAVATLAYRAAKPLRGAPPQFSAFRAGGGSRSAGEILAHLSDLLDWALSIARGEEVWQDTKPQSWTKDIERFHAALAAFDSFLSSGAALQSPAEKIFQGAIADALTHVGQLSLLRRLARSPVRPENYHVANIEAGLTGPNQNAPVMEFD